MHDSNEQITTPPAAALISFSRCSGSTTLFASDFDHQHYVRLRVKPAREHRSLGRTWYSAVHTVDYIDVAMSASQFAEAITSLNVGSGVPCTVKHLNGQNFPDVEHVSDRPTFEHEGKNICDDALAGIDSSLAEIDSLKISATAKKQIANGLIKTRRALIDSLPFLVESYSEHMDTIEQRAKQEIASYADHAMIQYGVRAIAELNVASVDKFQLIDAATEEIAGS
jgi:hypothetical protein